MKHPRLVLAGTNSGVGKTTLTLGIMLALRKKGLNVQPFKVGPDYIDPTYHTQVTGKASRNLDSWLLSKDVILELFERQAKKADISIIEGVMGLYDGANSSEAGSTGHLAKTIEGPVILIVDARALSRSAGAIVLGYKEFDKEVNIKGVILNNIGSSTHYHSAKDSIEKKTRIPVLGFLPRDKNLNLPERHLGLMPLYYKNRESVNAFYKKLLNLVEKNIDVNRILKISREALPLPCFKRTIFNVQPVQGRITIAIAKDEAFNFYYQDNLDILKHFGAKIVEFSPLGSKGLPQDIDGLYIGGGFPEVFASRLSGNLELKKDIRGQAGDGLPIYAECGGLMYLMKRLVNFQKEEFSLVGLFPGQVNMANRLQALGYVEIETLKNNILSRKGDKNKAHVFHWSYLRNVPKDLCHAYKINKNKEKALHDGLIKGNVLASYAHLHFGSNINFARNFIRSGGKYKYKA